MSKSAPLPNGANGSTTAEGRDSHGRFIKGWKGGPGNPHAKRVGQIRSVLLDAVSDDDVKAIVKALVDQAREGDVRAAAELFNRLIGRAGDAPVQGESAGEQSTMLTITPAESLAAIEERKGQPHDPMCGLRIADHDGIQPTG